MATKTISIQLVGRFEDQKDIRLDSFVEQLDAIEGILKELDYRFTGKQRASTYYRIIELLHDSPPTIVLEPVAVDPDVDLGNAIVEQFGNHLSAFAEKRLPRDLDDDLKKRYMRVFNNIDGNITRMRVTAGGKPIDITAKIARAVAPQGLADVEIRNTVSGKLETLQLHGKREFRIYPISGPTSIKCVFAEQLREAVLDAADNWVSVTGILRYVGGADYPTEMIVESLRLKKGPKELPSLGDLRGVGQALEKGITSEEVTRRLREDDW